MKLASKLLSLHEKVKGKLSGKVDKELAKEVKGVIAYLDKEFPDEKFTVNSPVVNTASGKLKLNKIVNIRAKEDGSFFQTMIGEIGQKFPKLLLRNPTGMGVNNPKTSVLRISLKRKE